MHLTNINVCNSIVLSLYLLLCFRHLFLILPTELALRSSLQDAIILQRVISSRLVLLIPDLSGGVEQIAYVGVAFDLYA